MTRNPVTLEMRHTHLYPGATGTASAGQTDRASVCLVIFADGTAVRGMLLPAETGAAVLDLPAYATARGTRIAAKSWLAGIAAADDGTVTLRIRKRL